MPEKLAVEGQSGGESVLNMHSEESGPTKKTKTKGYHILLMIISLMRYNL